MPSTPHSRPITTERDVAEAVCLAADEESGRLHFAAGADAIALSKPTAE